MQMRKSIRRPFFPAFPVHRIKLMVFPRHLYRGKSLTAVFRTRNDVFRVCHVIKCDLVVLFGRMSTASPMADRVFIRRRNLWCFDSDCSFFFGSDIFLFSLRLVCTWKNFWFGGCGSIVFQCWSIIFRLCCCWGLFRSVFVSRL